MSEEKDRLKDLFSEKLGNYEAKVNPELWNSIASKIATPAATSAFVGKTVLSKIIIGSSIAAAVAIGGYVFLSPETTPAPTITETSKSKKISSDSSEPNSPESFVQEKETITKAEKTNNVDSKNKIDNQVVTNHLEEVPLHANENKGETITTIRTEITEEITTTTTKNSSDGPSQKSVSKTSKTTKKEILKDNQNTDQQVDNTIENLPNVFTPNNDGSNDYFSIQSSGIKDFSIVVMDNQNTVVFKSDDADFKWNGVDLKGDQVAEGNYIYYVTGFNAKGKVITKYSALKVVR